ncbi:Asparaginase/glutaminase [Scheffersomyces xylosifermentans]|uniref:Asparaginase/glutaminase n=1 Tax=Scheffersomyces xylosifermentans TaxID=1304137 RepID=UPI00315DDBEE
MSMSSSSSFFQLHSLPEETTYEIHDDSRDVSHSQFRIRYRSNSIVSGTSETSTNFDTLPTIKVIGTGGTIASKGSTAHQTAGYEVDLTIEDLVHSIPDLSTTCILEYEQLLNIDSKEFGTKELLMLYEKIQTDLPKYDGIVITHGTDTMEETAFFLQLTINTYKPIVMCGSMRPSTAISSDGPMNLYQACVIAATRESRGRGVLIALNDRIGSGYYITKSNANSLDTFKSIGQGYVGNFVDNEIHYYYPAAKPLGMTYFNLQLPLSEVELPEVPVIYAHQGLNNKLIEVTVRELNAKGLVIATMGAGSLSDATNQFLADLVQNIGFPFPIIYAKRSMDGRVPLGALPKVRNDELSDPQTFDSAIAGGYLNPQKARILLQLCLNDRYDLNEIKKVFKGV